MEEWRERFLAVVDADGRSDRAISLAAGCNENAVNEIRNTAKSPRVDRLLALIGELDVSVAYIFTGIELSREDEDFLKTILSLSPAGRAGVLAIVQERLKA